ncbi:MAG: polysulfide reductase [Anaerolinea sp.]|nr:polysulfide reductase [Anaerolinea sp.]
METGAGRLEELALAPLRRTRRGYYLVLLGLLVIVGVGVFAYSRQLAGGLAVTGMAPTENKIMWGLYITNFVFFIGISHAGTLISAILRVSKADWRTPVTRMAEFITVVALMVGALFPIIDLGRPDRMLNVIRYGRFQSPILWDLFAISTYLFGSFVYLYLPLIPDLATCRDRLHDNISAPRRWFYRTFSAGWRGAPDQRRILAMALVLMMIVIIPVAVSVHTVVSWIFAMTLRTGWNSTMFGAYFVAGAIFSGTATLIVVMAILRRTNHLEAYITQKQFVYLGYLMAALGMVMVYFNLSEFVTAGYKLEEGEPVYLNQVFTGTFAPIYWFYIFGGLLLPALIVLMPWTRNVAGVLVAAVFVDIAMWLERYIIVVATLRVPQMPYNDLATYAPTWVEVAITAGAFALFAFLIMVFVKIVPVISIWEVSEQLEQEQGQPAIDALPFPAAQPAGGS